MKWKLSKEEYEGLDESFKKFYKVNDSGEYILQVEGGEDLGALKRAKEREKNNAREAKKEIKELKLELEAYKKAEEDKEEQQERNKNNIEALEKRWKAKHDKELSKKDSEIEKLKNTQKSLSNLVVDTVADGLASKISTIPELVAPLIKRRLSLDLESDIPITRVLDADGKISEISMDELQTEFRDNDKYAAIMIGSNASGGDKAEKVNQSSNFAGSEPSKSDLLKYSSNEFKEYLDGKKEKD